MKHLITAVRANAATPIEVLAFIKNLLVKVYSQHYYEKWGRKDYDLTFEEWQSLFVHDVMNNVIEKDNHYSIKLPSTVVGWVLRKHTKGKADRVGYDVSEEELAEYFNKMFATFGLFVSSYRKDAGNWIISLSPNRTNAVKVPRYLYTFSDLWNKERILRKGLIPSKSTRSGFSYPARVYLFTEYNLTNIRKMQHAVQSYDVSAEDMYYGRFKMEPIVVFRVDTTGLRARFYPDNNSRIDGKLRGVWTPTHIPPSALSIKFEDKET